MKSAPVLVVCGRGHRQRRKPRRRQPLQQARQARQKRRQVFLSEFFFHLCSKPCIEKASSFVWTLVFVQILIICPKLDFPFFEFDLLLFKRIHTYIHT
jgi:hypothetical protein